MIWLDIETRGPLDVTRHGAYAHAAHPDIRIISLHWAYGDGPVQHWRGLFSPGVEEADPEPVELLDRIEAGEEITIWNAQYERLVFDGPAGERLDLPRLKPQQLICAATWSRFHNLPGDLGGAGKAVLPTGQGKLASTKFKRLWHVDPDAPLGEADRPAFELMLDYGDQDVWAMREVCSYLTGVPAELRQDYAVSEAINDRGVYVSRRWIAHAASLKPAVELWINGDLTRLTDGAVPTVKSLAAARLWVHDLLAPYLDEEGLLTETGKDGNVVTIGHRALSRVKKHRRADGTGWWSETRPSLDKEVRRQLREWLMPTRDVDPSEEAPVPGKLINQLLEFLDLLDEGAGAAASKYEAAGRMLEGIGDDRLRGLYMLNGASQTGRFSSVQLQTHNLIRKPPPEDPGAVSAWVRAAPRRTLREDVQARWGMGVHELLGRMLRPTLQAPEGRALVWGDWSGIEARICPWLSQDFSYAAGEDFAGIRETRASAQRLLDMFKRGEDVYIAAAEAITGHKVEKDDPERQLGKVATLSLGFGGGVGAYAAMARNYGVKPMERETLKFIVSSWREANPWARAWWDELDGASMLAMWAPGGIYQAGRVSFTYLEGLLKGTLVMFLPDGRPLFYPNAEVKQVERFEDQWEDAIVFSHPRYGRSSLWYGQLAENATQATAASLLRRALRGLEADPGPGMTVGHTHDEVLREASENDIDAAMAHLRQHMLEVPEWATGLPLAVDCHWGWSYYWPEAD